MAGDAPSARPHAHLQDPEAHVDAVAADLEYFRRKRLEPRVLFLARRGIVTLSDLLRAKGTVDLALPQGPPLPLEARIRALEDHLDELIAAIAVTSTPLQKAHVVIDDTRRERGDYDPFFRIAERSYDGPLDERLARLEADLEDCMALVQVLSRALVLVGEVTEEDLRGRREELSSLGYRNGARIVARAWVDPEFKQRLLETGREAVRELDIPSGRLGKLGVAENAEDTHHVVVCTLCSCYPHDLLGDPPWWYRTDAYKQRIVEDPRAILRDMFGLDIGDDRTVKVHDSTSDVRWMVLPRRPAGTASMTEEELADLVTAESLVGTAEPLQPSETATPSWAGR